MLADNAALIMNDVNPTFSHIVTRKNGTENGNVADIGENPNALSLQTMWRAL